MLKKLKNHQKNRQQHTGNQMLKKLKNHLKIDSITPKVKLRESEGIVVSPTWKISQLWNNFKQSKKRYFNKPFRK